MDTCLAQVMNPNQNTTIRSSTLNASPGYPSSSQNEYFGKFLYCNEKVYKTYYTVPDFHMTSIKLSIIYIILYI